jgi:hypothetical protein
MPLPHRTHLTILALTYCLQDARATCANTNTNVTANGTVSGVVPFACPNGFALAGNASNTTNVTAASCCVSVCWLLGTRLWLKTLQQCCLYIVSCQAVAEHPSAGVLSSSAVVLECTAYPHVSQPFSNSFFHVYESDEARESGHLSCN